MAAEKRPASNVFESQQLVVKRQKSDANLQPGNALTTSRGGSGLAQGRTSGLKAPVMELSGHTAEIFAARFDPSGNLIASASMDRSINLWRTYGNCENFGQLLGHKGAVLDVQWSRDSRTVFSASADATVASWDLDTGERIRKHVGHDGVINCLDVTRRGEDLMLSGSDDGSFAIWDPRQKAAVDYIETEYPITAVAFSEAGSEIFTGGVTNSISVWDIRKKAVTYTLQGHQDTITSLQVSPDSQSLLSNSFDGTVRTWDVRPFAPTNRHLKTYDGAPPGIERNLIRASWDNKGERIAAGSGDRTVVVWDVRTGKLLYKLPGHKGTVNDVRFTPAEEPIILSASSDRNLILGELGK